MEIEEFLDTFPEKIATLSRLTQAFVKEDAAECREELHVGWRVVSYGYKKSFARLRLMPSGSTCIALVVVTTLNRDRYPDLVTVDWEQDTLTVSLGNEPDE